MFSGWPDCVDHGIEVCAVQLPGREERIGERPFVAIQPLVQAVADALGPRLDLPFALFGHSFGAIVAFELAREFRRRRAPSPVLLVVSGHRAPHMPWRRSPVAAQPQDIITSKLRELGGTPDAVLDDPEVLGQFLTAIRADLAVCEKYVFQAERPLQCPISAFGGADDDLLSAQELSGWRAHTRSDFAVSWFAGDHFFLRVSRPDAAGCVSQQLVRLLHAR
jgi:surfactin synthase thioesterase subunit